MFKLALRGISRYKKRTTITAFAVMIAVIFSIFTHTLITGILLDSEKNLIYNDTSSAKIYAQNYFEERDYLPIDYLISNKESTQLEKLLLDNGYSNFTKEYISSCDIMFYEDPYPTSGSLSVTLKAIDSDNTSAYNFSDSKIDGSWISKDKDGVVLGAKLADDIKAKVGYYLTVQTKGKGGFIQAFDIPIIGIISTGDPIVDSSTMFFDIDIIDYYLELEGSATSYAISYSNNISTVKKISKAETIKLDEIVNEINLEAYAWDKVAEELIKFQSADTGFGYVFLFFTFIIAIVGISNTMLMSISERKNEIAMLKTLGYTNKYIQMQFSIEGAFIGFFGTIIGVILGLIISYYYQINGIDFSFFLQNSPSIGYRINGVVHAYIDYFDIFLIILGAILVSLLSAFFAVRKTSKIEIIQLFKQV